MSNTDLNLLLADTPGMERFTRQAIALERACAASDFHLNPTICTVPHFNAWLNQWLNNNEHDELGNFVDVAQMARESLPRMKSSHTTRIRRVR